MPIRRMSPREIEQAIALRNSGYDYKHIGELFGFDGETIHRAIDKDYAAKRNDRVNERRRLRAIAAGEARACREIIRHPREDAAARIAEIPPDNRSFTARFFGDPIPNDPRRPWTMREGRA